MAAKVILFATPVFFILIALEFFWGLHKGRNTYRLNDAINSVSLGILSQITAFFGRGLRIGIYLLAYQWFTPQTGAPLAKFWNSPVGWVLALIFYDFCYYWLHRLGHESAILWAAHVVHHQSQEYNLSTALRQTSSGFLLGWIFYLPMALAGVPPDVFALVALIDLLYQFWVHTQHVGKLGWFDRVFCSPSNHRVHHGINDIYLDKNYGGILILWDRLFGTFQEETEPCVYGTRKPLNSWDPIWANLDVYIELAKKSWQLPRWRDKILVWLKPPGWLPPSAPSADPIYLFPPVYDPKLSATTRRIAMGLFIVALAGASAYLEFASKMPREAAVGACIALTGLLWILGRKIS